MKIINITKVMTSISQIVISMFSAVYVAQTFIANQKSLPSIIFGIWLVLLIANWVYPRIDYGLKGIDFRKNTYIKLREVKQ